MNPETEYGLTELSGILDIPLTTIQSEVKRMGDAGLVRTRKVGNTRLAAANTDHPAARPLTEILIPAYGPPAVIADSFRRLAGIGRVIIFGSWAARHSGVAGPPPGDIDVLLVGDGIDQLAVFGAADTAQSALRTPVNPILCTTQQWASPTDDVLLTQIQKAPFVEVFTTESQYPD